MKALEIKPAILLLKAIAICSLTAALLACHILSASAADPPRRLPNIIVIVSDDQGYGDVGCYGSKEAVTPELDRLAKEGVRLTDFYVTQPACTPTRAGFLTGRYPHRFGVTGALMVNSHPAWNKQGKWSGGIPAKETTLATLLKNEDYRTACFGKWHVGHGMGQRPADRGFDTSYVCAMGHVDCFTGLLFGERDMYEDGKLVDFAGGYTTDVFADRAIDFIEANKVKPFFIFLPFNAVHTSPPTKNRPGENYKAVVQARDEELAEFKQFKGHRQHYLAALKRMDHAIGRIDRALKKNGLSDDTLIIFFSDNGGDLDFGADNTPLRGEKAQVFEGGIRVPAIVRWPGILPAGTTCKEPVIQLDFFSMVLAAAKVTPPEGLSLDGKDPTATLAGKAGSPHEALFFKFRTGYAVRMGKYKLIKGGKTQMLFDLEADPGEEKNLAKSNPKMVKQLADLYRAFLKRA